jgi:hypothetical protein
VGGGGGLTASSQLTLHCQCCLVFCVENISLSLCPSMASIVPNEEVFAQFGLELETSTCLLLISSKFCDLSLLHWGREASAVRIIYCTVLTVQ